MKDIKKRLSLSSTLPPSAAAFLMGSKPASHHHGDNCGCGHHHHHHDHDEEEEE